MPINDPMITVTCDECGVETEPMGLTSLAGGGWDDRNIKRRLERMNWKVDGEKTICDECVEAAQEAK